MADGEPEAPAPAEDKHPTPEASSPEVEKPPPPEAPDAALPETKPVTETESKAKEVKKLEPKEMEKKEAEPKEVKVKMEKKEKGKVEIEPTTRRPAGASADAPILAVPMLAVPCFIAPPGFAVRVAVFSLSWLSGLLVASDGLNECALKFRVMLVMEAAFSGAFFFFNLRIDACCPYTPVNNMVSAGVRLQKQWCTLKCMFDDFGS